MFNYQENERTAIMNIFLLISLTDYAANPITFNMHIGYRLDNCAIETIIVRFRLNCVCACKNDQACLSVNVKELLMNGFM